MLCAAEVCAAVLPHVEESSCRRALRGVRVSVTSGYCQSICARTHWEVGTITGQASIESDVRHRARKNLEIVWGAETHRPTALPCAPIAIAMSGGEGRANSFGALNGKARRLTGVDCGPTLVARSRFGRQTGSAQPLGSASGQGAINRTGLRTGRGRLGAPSDPEQRFQLIPRQRGFRLAGT